MTASISLYYAPGACSLAPLLVLDELGAPFEARLVDFTRDAQHSPEYRQLNPKGRVPLLVVGAFRLTENPAILRYLATRVGDGTLWPCGVEDDARCHELLAWIASTVHAVYSHVTRPSRYVDGDEARVAVQEKGRQATLALWGDIEKMMTSRRWAVGDQLSVADYLLLTVWTWARKCGFAGDVAVTFPAWTAHARLLGERPATQCAFQREGIAMPV
ncbi:MAG: glutathione S-transferase [Variibacter sp.]|nr:glutathione S-transferase [Variibacter sp.]